MRFTSIATVFGLAAFASAQNSTAATVTSAAPTPEQTCIAACGTTDICCQARCVNVPCPNDLQANATTDCAAKCPQGSGSQADTDKYAQCQQACISSLFFPLSATAGTSGGSGSSQANPTGANGASSSGSGSGPSRTTSGSGSGTASPTGTPNAAPEIRFGAAGVSLLGLFVAGLAL